MIGAILFCGAVTGLIIRQNWPVIKKLLSELQQPNQLIQLPPASWSNLRPNLCKLH